MIINTFKFYVIRFIMFLFINLTMLDYVMTVIRINDNEQCCN